MAIDIKLTAQELATFVLANDQLKAAVLTAYLEANAPTLSVSDLTSDDSADASADSAEESKEDAAQALPLTA